jgi:hypothetical protein
MNLIFTKSPRSAGNINFAATSRANITAPGLRESTQAEAEAGTSLGKYMSPLRVAQAFAVLGATLIDDYWEALSHSVQEVTGASATVTTDIGWVVVNRAAPSTTALTLPDASTRSGVPLRISDYSTSVTEHTITLTPAVAAQKIMLQSTWTLFSNSASLASVTLWPVVIPSDPSNHVWIIAP